MKYLIIGLGIYGENLARDLTDAGHEVIGADINESTVENLKDYISTVYVIDSTDESQLAVLPLLNVDLIIVAIGENFGASVKTVALLKKVGAKHIYARAIDTLHEAILRSFDIDRIITPEQRAAADLTLEMQLGANVHTLQIDAQYIVAQFYATEYFSGMTISELTQKISDDFSLNLVAVCHPEEATNILGIKRTEMRRIAEPSYIIGRGDTITLWGMRERLTALLKKSRG